MYSFANMYFVRDSNLPEKPKLIAISISLVKGNPIKFNVLSNKCFEDVIIQVCKILKISPVTRHLFSLRVPQPQGKSCRSKPQIWMSLSSLIGDVLNTDFEFRIRFNVPDVSRLRDVDINAYDYYFNQVRKDLFTNSIPELNFSRNEGEILGLYVADMFRAVREEGRKKEEVLKDYKKYIPMKKIKKSWFFLRKDVKRLLYQINENLDIMSMKKNYFIQFKDIAPNYLTEEFKCMDGENLSEQNYVDVRVNPFHKTHSGISFKTGKSNEWQHVCAIDDICHLTINKEGNMEISRKNGIPVYLRFFHLPEMFSFATLLDGYYRLGVKWTFNLCKDLPTPSLQKLWHLRCHGPISEEFSYGKLAEKRNNAEGCYILRESDVTYDAYYIDVCNKSR